MVVCASSSSGHEQCSVVGQPLVIDNPGVRVALGDKTEDGLAVAFAAADFNVKARFISASN